MVGSNNGSSALLECHFEAYPPALSYWIHGEHKMIENNWKYKMTHEDTGPFSGHTTLNITHVEPVDYSLFKCVAKNERGKTFGLLTLYGKCSLSLPLAINGHSIYSYHDFFHGYHLSQLLLFL